ncbi:MAG: hypothetical protein AB4290_10285 [Spirulina sp.]
MSIDERIERLLALAEAHDRRIEACDRQIAELRETHQQQLDELREANLLLVQIVSQQQDDLREYKKTTNTALDRIEQTLRDLFGQQNNGSSN